MVKLKQQLSFAFIISILFAVGFGFVSYAVSEKKVTNFDQTIISGVQGAESPALTHVMKFFTFIGNGYCVVFVSAIVLFFLYQVLHHRKELILFIAVVVGSAVLNETLKLIFHRARPTLHRIVVANGFSFPSGHSMSAFSLYGIVAFLLWRHTSTPLGRGILIMLSMIMILTIGVSRIYLGVHYPSDVVGGFLASGCWLCASIWFYQRYQEKKYEEQLKRNT
ncbi:phosphatase PAP2 family protein [Paenibacillus cremeus]|uniref:Phosphatase PAP2 family protein n=1 Tax=Paenibacillus cremeus TaxID=2163881 RepID=A0A559JGJ8_9BACL|nr:phosphatase PAP2 family protein [Paenibacillus cremeus]TVX98995.1 phosphatase PAP2 family protein [Paenibacillus cremeus]